MKNIQKQKGITLVSLVVTIIILLILAGVTINIALGNNGLLNKSKESIEKSKLAQREEAIKMDLISAYIEAELSGLDKPSDETIKDIIEDNGGTIDESDPNIIHTPDGDIKLDDILNESSSSSQNPEDINKTVEELNNQINDLKSQLASLQNKQATGDAIESDVLAGKTFSNANAVGLTGTMINRGMLNFNPSTSTSQTVEPGYYTGGTLSTANAYEAGKADYVSGLKSVKQDCEFGFTSWCLTFEFFMPADFHSCACAIGHLYKDSKVTRYVCN